ncbi:MAG: 50S ribosomal protein L13 [Thermoprotei archaeon]|nr:MAG: 50S ribosomal protein L13 [Thermoprotei archaeon]
MSNEKILYVDATNQILGRLASILAKKLLEGYRIYVVNAEKAVISGERRRIIEGYKLVFKVSTHYNPYKTGIRRPRAPHNILKRTVRGMLPINKPRGRNAYKRLRVYIGVPNELRNKKFIKFQEADVNRLRRDYMYLGELAKELGWRGSLSE